MKALSVKQPWAELIARGEKRWEMRTWSTSYRGPLIILASAQRATSEGARRHAAVEAPLGVAVALVELLDVVPIAQRHPYFRPEAQCRISRGEFAWVLGDVVRLPPAPVKGRLGIFTLPPDTLDALTERLDLPIAVLKRIIRTEAA